MSTSPVAAAKFPTVGTPADQLLGTIRAERPDDIDWRHGKAFSLVYNVDDPEVEGLLGEVAHEFLHENALNPLRYKTLLHMEMEVIAAATTLFGAPEMSGSLSSGGTESIFLAVYTAREHGADRGVHQPNIVTATTAHPAFVKACHYLGLELRRVPPTADGRADVEAMIAAADRDTVLLVGSAPCYPYGVIDPIPELAAAAMANGYLCHVDACLGGWLLPFWERIGREVPPWDLRVEGVTSLSADIHKYGYCYKGVSTVSYRDPELAKKQVFWFEDWPGGLYASGTTAGTRPGPPIAGAWAIINHLGIDGYCRLARRVAAATDGFQAAIDAVDGLAITSNPDMSVWEFGPKPGSGIELASLSAAMDSRGWALDAQPGGLHLMLSPGHDKVVERFAEDLAWAVSQTATPEGEAVPYASVVGLD
jgi:glutamate/tyrosine decarboxylase-like PLP-dependent enzyme